jgi:L-fucose mutarotase/ribose pyranase (RbsD/FucU family)
MIAKNLNLNVLKKITAVQHGDGIFLGTTHFINNFYSFKISTKESTLRPLKLHNYS